MSALSIDDGAVLYIDAVRVMSALEVACVDQQPTGKPLARGLMTCGEATTLVPAVIRLCLMLWPDLADPDVLESAIRAAVARTATGTPS